MSSSTEPCESVSLLPHPGLYINLLLHSCTHLSHQTSTKLILEPQDEAIIVYNRMNQDTSHLLDSVRADPNTRPPFFWHHIRPDHQRYAIMEIWRNASPLTRRFFDQGGTNGEYGPNWVAGWLLYSVFRSRDVRNNRNRRKGESGVVADGKIYSFYF